MKIENTLFAFIKRSQEKEYLLFQTGLLNKNYVFRWLDSLEAPIDGQALENLPIFCSLAFAKEELSSFAERLQKERGNFRGLFLVGSLAEEEKAWQLYPCLYQEYFIYENSDKRLFYYLNQWLVRQNKTDFLQSAPSSSLSLGSHSCNLLELAYTNLPDPLIILEKQNFELKQFNPATLQFLDCSSEEELKNWLLPQLQNQIREREPSFWESTAPPSKKLFLFSIELEKPSGERLSAWINLNQFASQAQTYLLLGFSDVSRIKEVEEALAHSEARFKAMVQNSSDVLAILAADSAFIFLSSSAEHVLGFQPEELIGTSFFTHIYPEDIFIAKSAFLSCLQNPKKLFRSEFRFIRSAGNTTYLDCLFVNYLEDSSLPGIILNIRDITQRKLAEMALAESQERLDLALWAANLALWDLNLLNGKVFRNSNWEQLLGYCAHEIEPTQEFWKRRIHPQDYERVLTAFEMHLAGKLPFFQLEYRMRKKDGSWVWVLDSGKIVERGPTGKPQRVSGTIMDISERKLLEEEKKKQQAAILNALIEGQDQERKRIASELHDGLGQQLHAVKLHFNLLAASLREQNFQEIALVNEIADMITEAIQEVRSISHNLAPKSLQHFGLKVAIENLCERLKKSQPFHIVFDTINIPYHLSPHLEASIYRIVQETLSNIIKHAKAQNVTIQLWIHNDVLSLMIEDDGVGFRTWEAKKEKGLGLMNLETRVRLLNGVLTLDSYPNNGTTILIEIPLEPSGGGESSSKLL